MEKTLEEIFGYAVLCTEKCECPYCGSKNYKQEIETIKETGFPIMRCNDCNKIWWSD